jgi:hypothetical protein
MKFSNFSLEVSIERVRGKMAKMGKLKRKRGPEM